VLPEPVDGAGALATGAAEEATGAGASVATGEGSGEALVAMVVGAGTAAWEVDDALGDGAAVTNTPPGTAAAALEEAGVGELLPLSLPEPDEPDEVPPEQVPVSEPSLFPVCLSTTSGPGLGKITSLPSTVVQPSPRFALKTSGREENAVSLFEEPPEIVTVAQFM